MATIQQRDTLRRNGLMVWSRNLAPLARRAGLRGTLRQIRHIWEQLDALDPNAAEAPDVLEAAARSLGIATDEIVASGRWSAKP